MTTGTRILPDPTRRSDAACAVADAPAAGLIPSVADLPADITTEPPCPVTTKPEAGWRAFLEAMDVAAAIVTYAVCTPAAGRQPGGRHAYLIGLDAAKADPQLTEGLIRFAEQQWQGAAGIEFATFRMAHLAPYPGLHPVFATAQSPGSQVLGGFDHAAVMQSSGPGGTIRAVFFRATGAGGFDGCRQSLAASAPMFLAAAATRAAATRQQQHSELLEAMFDQVSLAVMLVDSTARPLFCNAEALALLEARDPLLRACDGSLACRGTAETKRLRGAIQSVASTGNDTEAVLRLGTGDGNWRMTFIVPARPRTAGGAAPCAMVLVDQHRPCEAPERLLHALGLLPSEQRFLNAFLRSSSITEAASQIGLSEETARTYLKRVRAKLGVHRQMELVQLIYGLVPPLRQPAA